MGQELCVLCFGSDQELLARKFYIISNRFGRVNWIFWNDKQSLIAT